MKLPFSYTNQTRWEQARKDRDHETLLKLLLDLLGLARLNEHDGLDEPDEEYPDQVHREAMYDVWATKILSAVASKEWAFFDEPGMAAKKIARSIASRISRLSKRERRVFPNTGAYNNVLRTGTELFANANYGHRDKVDQICQAIAQEKIDGKKEPTKTKRKPTEETLAFKRECGKSFEPEHDHQTMLDDLFDCVRRRIKDTKVLAVLNVMQKNSNPKTWAVDTIQQELHIRRETVIDAKSEIEELMRDELELQSRKRDSIDEQPNTNTDTRAESVGIDKLVA